MNSTSEVSTQETLISLCESNQDHILEDKDQKCQKEETQKSPINNELIVKDLIVQLVEEVEHSDIKEEKQEKCQESESQEKEEDKGHIANDQEENEKQSNQKEEEQLQQVIQKKISNDVSKVFVQYSSNMRNQLSFCISKLRNKEQITLIGFESCMGKVITMAEILKERVGWLHQLTKFIKRNLRKFNEVEKREKDQQQEKDMDKKQEITKEIGISIQLSLIGFGLKEQGYQKPQSPFDLANLKRKQFELNRQRNPSQRISRSYNQSRVMNNKFSTSKKKFYENQQGKQENSFRRRSFSVGYNRMKFRLSKRADLYIPLPSMNRNGFLQKKRVYHQEKRNHLQRPPQQNFMRRSNPLMMMNNNSYNNRRSFSRERNERI